MKATFFQGQHNIVVDCTSCGGKFWGDYLEFYKLYPEELKKAENDECNPKSVCCECSDREEASLVQVSKTWGYKTTDFFNIRSIAKELETSS